MKKITLAGFLMTAACFVNAPGQTPSPEPKDEKSPPKGVFVVDPNQINYPARKNDKSDVILKEAKVAKGVVNRAALSLPKPSYPAAAKAVRAGGTVNVQVLIDEDGNVAMATAVAGHPLLREVSEKAALGAKFKPTLLEGQPVKVNGVIVYNFIPPAPPDSEGLSAPQNSESSDPRMISKGVVNGSAINLPKPQYPAAARAVGAEGAVNVMITIDEDGNVISAEAVSGHPLLRQSAQQAALGAKFRPTLLGGQAVKVNGVLVYNFVGPGMNWSMTGFSLGVAEKDGIRGTIELPEDFVSEKNQLKMVGELSRQEQSVQITNTIALIKSRLSPTDLWRFEFGLAKGRILSDRNDDETIRKNLAKFKELSFNNPGGIPSYEINRVVELAKFADKNSLTTEDKETIYSYLK